VYISLKRKKRGEAKSNRRPGMKHKLPDCDMYHNCMAIHRISCCSILARSERKKKKERKKKEGKKKEMSTTITPSKQKEHARHNECIYIFTRYVHISFIHCVCFSLVLNW